MNANTVNKALSTARACRSFKGRDFFESSVARSPEFTRWAKRYTARADRRLSKALTREVAW